MRLEPDHRSEMVNQLLFGEHFGDLDTELRLRLSDLTTHVKKILGESDALDMLAQIVTRGLANVMEHMEVTDILGQMEDGPLPDRHLVSGKQKKTGKSKKRRSR